MILSEPKKFYKFLFIFSLFIISFSSGIFAQNESVVEVTQKILQNKSYGECKNFKPGRVILFLPPVYPEEAKKTFVGGTVSVIVGVDERGIISQIKEISGNELLKINADKFARKTRFTPTVCDEVPVKTNALITYNFIPYIARQNFVKPEKTGSVNDVSETSQYFEPIRNLSENYKIAFGFDNNFYENAPLTRGDFAHFLRLTLDLLAERIKLTEGKQPNVFSAYNIYKINSASKIKDLENNRFYSDSVKVLLQNYRIALVDEKNRFQADAPLKQNELLDLWRNIFGEDAVPIHFHKSVKTDKIVTRGEFALFLDEGLRVLTYKVLP